MFQLQRIHWTEEIYAVKIKHGELCILEKNIGSHVLQGSHQQFVEISREYLTPAS